MGAADGVPPAAARVATAGGDALLTAGIAEAHSTGPADPEIAFALLRDKVQGMAGYTPIALGAHLLGAVIVELLFARTAPLALRAGWGAAFVALWILRSLLGWRYAARPPRSERALRRWLRGWLAGVLASAALWGAAAWLFYGHGDGLQRTALLLVVYSYCVASVPVLAPQFAVYLVVIGLQFLPAVVRVALDDRPYAGELAVVMAIIWLVTAALGHNHRQSFEALARLRLAADRLMAQLRAEKEVSDAARLQAEVASRAKTQFFAAASHDLRQPLHALGLFAEALRQRSGRDGPAVELVNSINASVDALEGLFSELLDISRIDSGAIEVKPRGFPVGEVFRRLRHDFEPVAFDKGLGLRFRGARHHALADPLLVERILRNLVVERAALHHRRRRAGRRAPARRPAAAAGARYRHRHRRRRPRTGVRGVLPGRPRRRSDARPEEGAGARAGDRQAAGRADGRAAGAGLDARPRHAVHARPARRRRAAAGAGRRPAGVEGGAVDHARRPAHRRRRGRAGGAPRPRGAAGRLGRRGDELRQRRRGRCLGGATGRRHAPRPTC